MSYFNIVAATSENTVVTEYIPEQRTSDAYQSEAELERDFIRRLGELGYEYLTIHKENDLIENLRKQLETLNSYAFTDSEWKRFFTEYIANSNEGIVEKTKTIQEDSVKNLKRDDGTTKNITLIDKKNIHNNCLQVINQYEVDTGKRQNRYDVTVLVNGFPLVHIELKRRGVPIREAFNQIDRYQCDSFWAGSGLFEYVQIFVISNGTNTKYYSNTTRFNAVKEAGKSRKKTKTSNSFEFTSFWADASNKVIPDLVDFTKTFFAKHTILNILTKYCIFTSENLLLVMRPYQIVATERILNRIEIAHNYKKYGSIAGGGYIWHTTGSGKTLTSFKSARLASKLNYIYKVLFVVDRKDLDYQTMREYDRFEKGAANSNTSTTILKRQLENPDCRIIITTIQKLATFIKKNTTHDVYDKRVVIIFDECHRSQFGDMHTAITKKFRKYHFFGFTGTPIFALNSGTSKNPNLRTTAQAFGDQLHSYTIVDAINDKNVLPFRVDYIKTMDKEEDIEDVKVWDIDREKAYMSPKRIALVTKYILDHFNQKTYRNERTYSYNVLTNISEVAESKKREQVQEVKDKRRISGFNSIFAVSSVQAAKLYYEEFLKQMTASPEKALKIAVIYSYGANEEDPDGILDEENPEDTSALDSTSRDFLEKAINDYNKQFNTNYDTSSDKFQSYYKDVSLRMKNKELDLLIVVNMFLTGFDATTLNTLWVDKNLKMHGLIQAYSRTNRILNSIKTFGNIVCFRALKKRTDTAISLFGDKEAGGIVTLQSFGEYYNGYEDSKGKHIDGYVDMIDRLLKDFPLDEPKIVGEERQKELLAEQKENNPRAKMTRSKTLGWYYETEQIKHRIAQYKGEMIYTPRTKIRVTVPKAPESDKNKFVRDAIDRSNMKLTSKAMNILSKYGVTVDEAKDAAVAAFAERTSLVGKLNNINEEIKAREEQLFWLTHYLDVKPFHDKYMSLKGRKQQKYADRFDAELYRYIVWESDLKKVYQKKFPTVNQLEDYIEKLKGKRDKKNAEYVIADQKSRELSEVAREIEKFFSKEQVQSRDQQKKRKRNDLE